MQVAERDVGQAGKQRRGHVADAADPDVSLGRRVDSPRDESVRRHDRSRDAALLRVGLDQLDRGREHGGVRAFGSQVGHHRVGQQVRDAVQGHLAVLVGQQHRPRDVRHGRAKVHPCQLAQPRAEPKPDRRVVVAAGKEHRNPGGGKAAKRVVEHGDRVGGRYGPVVDIPCHHHRLHLAVDRLGEQPIEEGRLVGEQALAVEGSPEMPVRGVEQSHPALQHS